MEKHLIFKRGQQNTSNNEVVKSKRPLPVIPTKNNTRTVNLDPQQKEIVESDAKNIIVVAAAGSGKTRVLTERIKYLLDNGVSPYNIVAITFTNLAAEEMRVRLKECNGIGDAFIGTIHSFANRIMKESGHDYKLFTDELDVKYHSYLIEKYCDILKAKKWLEFKDLTTAVSLGKESEFVLNTFLTPSERGELNKIERSVKDVENNVKECKKQKVRCKFPESVKTICKKDGVIDFDELLEMANAYFQEIGANTEHVLVDELQDIGSLEYTFIMGLNAENYFFVGDDYQNIYGFKGANVKIFMSLVDNPDFTTYFLNTNYRNAPEILEIAQRVINQVSDKINKDVIPYRFDAKGTVIVNNKGNLNIALEAIKASGSYRDWFILTRSNKELYEMTNKCLDAGIPHITFKREGLSLADLNKRMNSDRVKILTVHTSKGLESKNVLLYGSFPIVCPSYRMNTEERKVLYVGITRAEDNIIILN